MMKAIKNFMNKPVTWGDSFKWSGIVLGLYWYYGNDWIYAVCIWRTERILPSMA